MASLEQAPLNELLSKLWLDGGFSNGNSGESKVSGSISALLDSLPDEGRLVRSYLIPKGLEHDINKIHQIRAAWADRGQAIHSAATLGAYWLHKCLSLHAECCQVLALRNDTLVWPHRLVDLIDYQPAALSGDSTLKIVQTEGRQEPYCALSYRWKSESHNLVFLTSKNSVEFSNGVSPYKLPSAIQDACTLAKHVGIRYIWVDALCIIQGPGGDWHKEAKKMSSIYLNATFTIAAVDGTRLEAAPPVQSFLTEQARFFNHHRDFDWSNPETVYRLLSETENFTSRENGELDDRGWVFQEQMLSRRVVSLTRKDIFWDCLHHSASGRRLAGILGDFSPGFRDSDDRVFKRLLLGSSVVGSLIGPSDGYWYWRKAVQDYTRRTLTYEKDRLIALDGIINRMSEILRDSCHLGIWERDELRSLIWFVDPNECHPSEPAVKAPSWSWISVNGPISYRLWHPYARYLQSKRERLLPVAYVRHISSRNKNPFEFSNFVGQLEIRGPVVEGYVIEQTLFIDMKRAASDTPQPRSSRGGLDAQEQVAQDLYEDRHKSHEDRLFHHETFLKDPRLFVEEHMTIKIKTKLPLIRNLKPSEAYIEVDVKIPRLVKCMLLCEGGYSTPLTAQYCLVLENTWLRFSYFSGYEHQRIGLCAIDSMRLCLRSKKTCPKRGEAGHQCLGCLETLQIT